jgi:hypothetical protein
VIKIFRLIVIKVPAVMQNRVNNYSYNFLPNLPMNRQRKKTCSFAGGMYFMQLLKLFGGMKQYF